jgi:lipoprotein NlpD
MPSLESRRAVERASRTIPALRIVALVAMLAVLAGCATRRPAPVEDRAGARPPATAGAPTADVRPAEAPPVPTYTVKRGDTLYQIALDNGLDYRELAAWNGIENVNLIRVGQVLRLLAPGEVPPPVAAGTVTNADGVTTAPLRTVPPVAEAPRGVALPPPVGGASPPPPPTVAGGNVKTGPKAVKEPYSDQAVRDLTLAATAVPAPPSEAPRVARVEPRPDTSAPVAPAPPPAARGGDGDDDEKLDWLWPARGKVVTSFSETANLKGIDIAGTSGEPVVASAAGKVVYAGAGLRGYGKLIIIKHNKTYLSAYAHNREILVKEGAQVSRGQKIAEMGNTDADQVKLHFEIRRLGKPMDPSRFLPPA